MKSFHFCSQHLGKAQGDDYTLDDMFVTASATKGSVRNEDKRTREKAMKGLWFLLRSINKSLWFRLRSINTLR